MAPDQTTQVSSPATTVDIIYGDEPAVIIVKRSVGVQGGERALTLRPLVRDAALFQRLTIGHENGYATYLADFSLIDPSVSAPRATATVS